MMKAEAASEEATTKKAVAEAAKEKAEKEEKEAAEEAAANDAAAEKAKAVGTAAEAITADKAAVLGLLQPLEALSLDADELRRVTAAAVAFCDDQGVKSFSDLQTRASRLTERTPADSRAVHELPCGPACTPLARGIS